MVAAGDGSDVFISYVRSNEAAVADVNGWLCPQGFSTFFDRNMASPEPQVVPALDEAINRYKVVAILVGKHGIGDTLLSARAARIAV
jgi:hypothetical protein